MNRRQDSRMISEMKEQLRRLQERRQELESRQVDEEEALGQKSIVPHLARVMRDRQWAQVRSMIQSNMECIDQDIQETIGRLGAAMLEETGDPAQSPRRSQRHFPDLIPRKASQSPQKPKTEQPVHSFSSNQQQPGFLPQPGSPSRQALLEAVKETLERRKKPAIDEEEEKGKESEQSPRVGFYRFRHTETVAAAVQEDKLSRLSVQKLPSVTIATRKPDRPLNHVISVQSPSIVSTICQSPASVELLTERTASSSSSSANHHQQQSPPNLEIQPDDVARLFCDLLATQLELAVDSIGPIQQPESPRQCQRDNDDDDDNEFRLTIDSCTQTTICNVKDSSTVMERWHQTDRAVGPDRPVSSDSEEEEIMQVSSKVEQEVKVEEEVDEPLTPPRTSCNNIVPDPAPPLDLNLWRRRYPPTPPSSCFESLIRQVEAAAHESLSNMTAVASSSSSSSDATGILLSSSSLSTNASSSSATVAVSWLSEGEVPNRVTSPGQVAVQKIRGATGNNMDRSAEVTLSEGQIPFRDIVPSSNFRLASTLLDGSSQGEILLPQQQTSRSDSTASFQSATGSLGEIPAERFSPTDDDLESE
ncbi:uncharacterized protein LOC124189032 [Daphnia pulex]|uniref:uncharacterized protein LOC124189032 n=1 Tax=Daphnia pulex TaxID=6669 RepID=UPI001EE0867C|nr:uncharacterized protein LOC124189032 [Daphnia pulex]